MNTLKHRTVKREGYEWAIEIHEVRGRPFSRLANIRRGGDGWAVVHLYNDGRVKTLPILPYQKVPESVMIEVRKDLGVQ